MTILERARADVRDAWTATSAGEHYRGARWASTRRRERDAVRLRALIERHAPDALRGATWLDVACGTGRLAHSWQPAARNYLGIDASPAMLAEHPLSGRVARADAFRLPFATDSFELVVACRFLHHLVQRADLDAAVDELCRVTRELVAVTFWDSRSLADWRRPKRGDRADDPRVARPGTELVEAFERAGARVLEMRHSFRFVSRQAYLVARVR
ncbi:MAG: class I SAM-dependent methyltransferase [Planctomycetota bacterium]